MDLVSFKKVDSHVVEQKKKNDEKKFSEFVQNFYMMSKSSLLKRIGIFIYGKKKVIPQYCSFYYNCTKKKKKYFLLNLNDSLF